MLLILTFTASAVWGVMYLTQQTRDRNAQVQGQALLELADRQLLQFMVRERRLPCPDRDGDGEEDCSGGHAKGYLPYLTLGMAARRYSPGEVPLLYGVYRSGGNDLARRTSRFSPTDSDGKVYPPPQVEGDDDPYANLLDYCMALDSANPTSDTEVSRNALHSLEADGRASNIAYALAAPGRLNADGQGTGQLGPYDGINSDLATPAFASPDTPLVRDAYDDATLVRGFTEIEDVLTCDIVRRSLNLMADGMAFQQEVCDLTADNADNADLGVKLAAVGTARSAADIALNAITVSGSGKEIAKATTALTAATASCAVLVGCGLIPVYSTALSIAGVSQGLSATALGLSAATTAAYVIYTLRYDRIKTKIDAANALCQQDSISDDNPPPEINFTKEIAALNVKLLALDNEKADAEQALKDSQVPAAEAETAWLDAKDTLENAIEALPSDTEAEQARKAALVDLIGDLDKEPPEPEALDEEQQDCLSEEIENGADYEEAQQTCHIDPPPKPETKTLADALINYKSAELSLVDIEQSSTGTATTLPEVDIDQIPEEQRDAFIKQQQQMEEASTQTSAAKDEAIAERDAAKDKLTELLAEANALWRDADAPGEEATPISTLVSRHEAYTTTAAEVYKAEQEVERIESQINQTKGEIASYGCEQQGQQYQPDEDQPGTGTCVDKQPQTPEALLEKNAEILEKHGVEIKDGGDDDYQAPEIPPSFQRDAGLEILRKADTLGTGR
ncbi:hypothetical protein [Marichromatium bheemlicum]|uniref:Uncharacterized protein n=1 Tax=Marichromatium bheemlicum TaxID=365339 RepID=A0ABX1I7K1_9GAMM|nr:hypothetical protein [Marichromatium bheemlicum]NKN32380.1 hypothetical protein [Marichromatium bheemlicum]